METLSQLPRGLSTLSLTSASDLSSSNGAAVVGCSGGGSVGWRSPATPISMPQPDDELTCTPDDLAAGNSGRAATTRRVTFVDETPVRLPYRRVAASTDGVVIDVVREASEAEAVVAAASVVKLAGSGVASSASILAAPRRGSSLALQARLHALKADVELDGDDDNEKEDAIGGLDSDDPRLVDARSRAANAAHDERLFVGLRRADVSAGSIDRVAVAESALATRRPPRCRPPPSLVDPPDPTELWRHEEAAHEPVDCGLGGFDAGAFLRPGPVLRGLAPPESLACVMQRWSGTEPRNCYF